MRMQRTKVNAGIRKFAVGDFVKHPTKGTGVIDAISSHPFSNVFILSWDGRGERPRRPVCDWFSAPPSMLVLAPPVAVRLKRTR